MPCLKYIIQNANQQEHKMLRGKTIECVSLIGLAVGSEKVSNKFSKDCHIKNSSSNLRFIYIFTVYFGR